MGHAASHKPHGPQPFGRYELVRRIGAGGMGEVWLARLKGLSGIDKMCVVKKILPHLSEDRQFVSRFLDEAKVVVHLAHGNIAQVFEMGEVDGQYFMAMEYVEGKTLARAIQRLRQDGRQFPIDLALYVGIRICDALAYAHAKKDPTGRDLSVVHRDISPTNVLVSYGGEVKIIDFGAALSTMKETETAPRVVIGNLAYMSPEQARKQHVDARADLFSASVVLWELIAWRALPTSDDYVERWRRAAYPKFDPPSKHNPRVSKDVDRVLMKGLASKPDERWQTAEELRNELNSCLSQIAPNTSQTTLSAFLSTTFADDLAADRAAVVEAMQARAQPPPAARPRPPPRREEPRDEPDQVTDQQSVPEAGTNRVKNPFDESVITGETPDSAPTHAVRLEDLQRENERQSKSKQLGAGDVDDTTAPARGRKDKDAGAPPVSGPGAIGVARSMTGEETTQTHKRPPLSKQLVLRIALFALAFGIGVGIVIALLQPATPAPPPGAEAQQLVSP